MERQIEFIDRTLAESAIEPEVEWAQALETRLEFFPPADTSDWRSAYFWAVHRGHWIEAEKRGRQPVVPEAADAVGIALLRSRLARLQAEVLLLARQLEDADNAASKSAPAEEVQMDPRLEWCRDNADQLRAHPHSYAAIASDDGLIATANTLREIRAHLAERGIDRRTVLIVRTDDFRA